MGDMMSYTVRSAAAQMLPALGANLTKAKAHCQAIGAEEAGMLESRLFPNMHPLRRQVQMACDGLARGATRLAGAEMPSFPDTETSFDELIARTQKASQYVLGLDAGAMDANENQTVSVDLGPMKFDWEGRFYLTAFIMPNVMFHTTTAYDLMRMGGVELGKRDFLGLRE